MSRQTSSPKLGRLAIVSLGVAALLTGAAASTLEMTGVVDFSQWRERYVQPLLALRPGARSPNGTETTPAPSMVKALAQQPLAARAASLERLAAERRSPESAPARFLLASDRIQQGRAGSALPLLEGLEEDYGVLAPFIAVKRAQAIAATGDAVGANAAWEEVLQKYGRHPVAAEALVALDKLDPSYGDRAIADFPRHPRTIDLVLARLQAGTPDELALLRLLAQAGYDRPGITRWLDYLVETYGGDLTPADWEAVGFAYWDNQSYRYAGEAYLNATASPLTLYRAGRGLQLGDQRAVAIAAYRDLASTFPDAPETAEGLLKLSQLVSAEEALTLLDQVIAQFPDRAAEALYERSLVLDELEQPETAAQSRELLLTQHSDSEAAAQIRWQQAQRQAEAQNYAQAWNWARELLIANPESEIAAEAGFWAGKWALQLNRPDDAQAVFELVIAHYPESYYAWRSAFYLGWDVGDFTTVRDRTPELQLPTQRSHLPVGSDALNELYQLGQNRDAWMLWRVEFQNVVQPSVAEQFTDGLIRLAIGEHLDGIFMVSNLAWREAPADREAYRDLATQEVYWQSLYPFPFQELIQKWSQERNLNPLLVTALIRQESRFEPQIESVVGAKGLMQVMPETAEWIDLQIDAGDYALTDPDDNIRLGTWYLDFTHREYQNHSLYAVASYNAGPGNVADWLARFRVNDPDEFVRLIPFPETQNYVTSVFGGYWNYLRLYHPPVADRVAQYTNRRSTAAEILRSANP